MTSSMKKVGRTKETDRICPNLGLNVPRNRITSPELQTPNPALDTDPNQLGSQYETDNAEQTPPTPAPLGWGRSASSLGITHHRTKQ